MKKFLLIITSCLFSSGAIANHAIQYDIRIDGITCPFCVATSEKALMKLDGVGSISSNLESGVISVCGPNSLVLEESQMRSLFLKKGFTFRSLSKMENCSIDDNPLSDSEHHHADGQEHKHE